MGSYAQKSWLNRLAWDLDSPAWLSFLFGLDFLAEQRHYFVTEEVWKLRNN